MATLLARGFDDVLTERMVDLSEAFVTEQIALDATVGFYVDRNLLSAPGAEQLKIQPWAIWGVETVQDAQQGTANQIRQETITLTCDLYVAKAADLEDADDEGKALARLSYFKEQIKAVIFRRANHQLGFSPGTIAKKRNFRFQQFAPTSENTEEWIVGGRVTVDLDYSWTPEDVTGTPIDEISITVEVDTALWAGLYSYA